MHTIQHIRHSPRFRMVEVERVERLTPRMIRIVFGGDLGGFQSEAHDDHIKMFFPAVGESRIPVPEITTEGTRFAVGHQPAARNFTPRYFDPVTRELTVDFVLHGDGPATEWAARAAPGHVVGIGGPRGSFVVADDFDWYLLVADETGLPALARRIEELRPDVPVFAFVEVEDSDEEPAIGAYTGKPVTFVHRAGRSASGFKGLREAIATFAPPAGAGFAWVACESVKAKALRAMLVTELNLNPKWVRAAGYWRAGATAVHEKFED